MEKIINKYIRGAAQIQWFQDTVVGTGEDAEGETRVNHVLRAVRQNEQSNLSSSSSAIIILNLYRCFSASLYYKETGLFHFRLYIIFYLTVNQNSVVGTDNG